MLRRALRSGQRGTVVTIQGFEMFGGGANVTAVQLAGNPVASIAKYRSTRRRALWWPALTRWAVSEVGDVVIPSDTGLDVTGRGVDLPAIDGRLH